MALVAIVMAGVIFAINRKGPSGSSGSTPTAATTTKNSSASSSATLSEDGTYRVVPQNLMPVEGQMQRATLWLLKAVSGRPDFVIGDPAVTVPANCSLANTPASQTTWGDARSLATQMFTDGTADKYADSAWAGLAVFATADAAKQSLDKVTDSLKTCADRYTVPARGSAKESSQQIHVVHQSDDSVSWTINYFDPGLPWVCNENYTRAANLAITASTCGQAESDSADRVVALVTDKLQKK